MDTLMVARLAADPVVQVLSEKIVLIGTYPQATWDLHPDGDRIVIARIPDAEQVEESVVRQVVVVNWFEELRAAVKSGELRGPLDLD